MANAADTAAQYGYSVAFFNSDPELKKLLNQAVTGNWNPAQFVAKLQATKWFRTKGEAARQIYALKTSDPATYNQRLASAKSQVQQLYRDVGAYTTTANLGQVAENALAFGWTDSQIKDALSKFITPDKGGYYHGQAASVQQRLKELAGEYGYNASTKQMGMWTRNIASGAATVEQVQQAIVNYTASKYPALKDRLLSGETLDQIAAPYKDSYSKVLEVNPETIGFDDRLLQGALATKDSKGKPSTKTVWQFEQDLRADPRYLKTKQAQDKGMALGRKILSDFGLLSS